jgi:hypothetical protein
MPTDDLEPHSACIQLRIALGGIRMSQRKAEHISVKDGSTVQVADTLDNKTDSLLHF